jgi:hypothetical protein
MTSWDYLGSNHSGCAETSDWEDNQWCYVVGGEACSAASNSTHAGESRKWKVCDPCKCTASWDYLGATYSTCAETADWADHTWCYVQGGAECHNALNSTVDGESRKWRECDDCACRGNWEYLGSFYSGCAETSDWEDNQWCYVQGDGDKCAAASDSTHAGESRKWRSCSAVASVEFVAVLEVSDAAAFVADASIKSALECEMASKLSVPCENVQAELSLASRRLSSRRLSSGQVAVRFVVTPSESSSTPACRRL